MLYTLVFSRENHLGGRRDVILYSSWSLLKRALEHVGMSGGQLRAAEEALKTIAPGYNFQDRIELSKEQIDFPLQQFDLGCARRVNLGCP